MIKKRIKNYKTRQGIEANVASLLFDLLLDCKKNDQIFSNKIEIYEKHKVPSCFWQICDGQLDKSMRQLGIYPVAVAQPSPARKFDALPGTVPITTTVPNS